MACKWSACPLIAQPVSNASWRCGLTYCFPVVQAVCILKQEKPDWDTAKRVLSDTGFMKSLLEFDKDNIPDAVIKRLKKWVPLTSASMVLACTSQSLQQGTAAQLQFAAEAGSSLMETSAVANMCLQVH